MSVLKDMTKGVMTTKATKAAKLTPVAGESGTTVAQAAAAVLPNDLPGRFMSSEELGEAAKGLRSHAATLLGVADAIDLLIDTNARRSDKVDTKALAEDAKRAEERAADARVAEANASEETTEEFKSRMQRLSAEAQAAVFTAADDDGAAEEPVALPDIEPLVIDEPAPEGWSCSEHPKVKPITMNARNGSSYLMCGDDDCEQYERK